MELLKTFNYSSVPCIRMLTAFTVDTCDKTLKGWVLIIEYVDHFENIMCRPVILSCNCRVSPREVNTFNLAFPSSTFNGSGERHRYDKELRL